MPMLPDYSTLSPTRRLAATLVDGLRKELALTPKPGLVDCISNGSHPDLSYALMSASIELLSSYFAASAEALEAGCGVETLRELGKCFEQSMLVCFQSNTHRGALFLGGILLAAVERSPGGDEAALSYAVATVAKQLFDKRVPHDTIGAKVRRQYAAGGIVTESLQGLPSVFEFSLPALRDGLDRGMSQRDARLLAMAVLMQTVEDTTTLRRCGPLGLAMVCEDGRRLENILYAGKSPVSYLKDADDRYRERRLTMGGVADLLAVTIALHHFFLPIDGNGEGQVPQGRDLSIGCY
ncbi:MAG: triphosphoribosyl-dephospho-CoA synthase [Candidatus Thiodiazotropha sp.]